MGLLWPNLLIHGQGWFEGWILRFGLAITGLSIWVRVNHHRLSFGISSMSHPLDYRISILKQNPSLKQLKQKPSTYAIFAAHLWRCVTKARSLPYDQEVRLYIPVNGRSRLKEPSLPKGYFGNVLFRGVCIAKAGDIASQPLFCTTGIVQEAIARMDNEYLRSAIDYLAVNPGLSSLNPSLTWIQQERSPNLSINSWFGIPFEEADFGLGEPTWVRLGGVGYEGQTLIMPSTNGDGSLSVSINLSMAHMNIFKNYIYDFVEILPSL
ncbi:anthranilate N-benzoyltransferase protein 1-like isoform X2 [Silene latifolia]|uniref:anthranilate N-benzoyltransferase protein 1-like isoform X2 n=1 Tax=Silene latifolia TaxID=37657 RepID=UPI003D76DA8E